MMSRPQIESSDFSPEALKAEILSDAKSLGIALTTADIIADKIILKVTNWVEKRAAVTQADIHRRVAKEAARYHKDLAYVYQNRGKII